MDQQRGTGGNASTGSAAGAVAAGDASAGQAARLVALTALAMLAFTGNSLLCRLALTRTDIDAASFTTIRLVAGAVTLWLLVHASRRGATGQGSWLSALALFGYAAGFSFAYISLDAGTGALLLFGAVQVSMIGWGLWHGERLGTWQLCGFLLACTGLVALSWPGVSAPPLTGALLMLTAGAAWGVYSLRAKGAGDPLRVTAGNFLRSVPIALVLTALWTGPTSLDGAGVACAIASGALTSGIGYAIWYTVLPSLRATTAATVQLSVPVLAAIGGVLLLAEPMTTRLGLSSAAVLGGIALVILCKPSAKA